MQEFEELKREIPGVQKAVPLNDHTTFRIGGPAKYFFVAKTSEDLAKTVGAARKLKLPLFLLSGGSNVLVADSGFSGLVVKVQNTKYKIPARHASRGDAGGHNTRVWAEAGVSMGTLVRETGKRGLAGLEWAGGLPGTLGGAIRGNAGAFGGEIKDSVFEVETLDQKGVRRKFSRQQCQFAYRSSLFKQKGYVVLAATLQLKKGDKKKIQEEAKDHTRYRKARHPLEYPNAGSIFKNCDVRNVPEAVRNEFRDVMKNDPFPVIPAAAIIARANLQGLRVGGAEVSEKHPNYIVNTGGATGADVLRLVENIKQRVRKQFSIDLQEEITFPH